MFKHGYIFLITDVTFWPLSKLPTLNAMLAWELSCEWSAGHFVCFTSSGSAVQFLHLRVVPPLPSCKPGESFLTSPFKQGVLFVLLACYLQCTASVRHFVFSVTGQVAGPCWNRNSLIGYVIAFHKRMSWLASRCHKGTLHWTYGCLNSPLH